MLSPFLVLSHHKLTLWYGIVLIISLTLLATDLAVELEIEIERR